jgi:hypothetical protein
MLSFLTGGIGKYALIAVAAIALVGLVYAKGYGAASARYEVVLAKAEADFNRLQDIVARGIAEGDREFLAGIAAGGQANQDQIDAHEAALAIDACLAQLPDIEFLRRFRP